jgi:amino acid transporter
MPLNAYLLSTVIQLLIGLMYLGSSTAFNAFVGVAVICLGVSYAMPVAISLFNGRRDMDGAPFALGKWGIVINSVAVMWALFMIVLFSMPAVIPVTKTSMSTFVFRISIVFPLLLIGWTDYASVVFIGFGVISGIWYLISK